MIRHSYEDWATGNAAPPAPDLLEAFSGTSIVRWASTIKYRLQRLIDEQEANRNFEYAEILRTFLNTWEANPITGSINRETLELLKAAASPLSVMKWNQASYFQGLTTSLDELIADQEQVPTGMPDQDASPGGAGMTTPPMGNDFGPEENPPGDDLGGEPGKEDSGLPDAPGAEEEDPNNKTQLPPL
jgi:hypothetical protein